MLKRLAPLLALAFAAACAGAPVATSPTPSASTSATTAPTPSGSAAPALLDHGIAYFARDRLPPVGRRVAGAGFGQNAAERIRSRLVQLAGAVPSAAGEANLLRTMKAKLQGITVDRDLVSLDFAAPDDDWGVNGAPAVRGLVQQIVYTATEEPGITRALITQNGGKQAVIGGEGLVIDEPHSRDEISGYARRSPATADAQGDISAAFGYLHRWSIEDVAPALARLVLETDLNPVGGRTMPWIHADIRPNDESAVPQLGKFALTLDVPFAKPSFAGMTMEGNRGVVIVDRTPLRSIRVMAQGNGVRYELGLDDQRPWRVGLLWDPVRIVVDVGGDPEQLTPGTAVYAPRFAAETQSIFSLTGMARAFEANVNWRVKDTTGAVVARGTTNATLGTSPVWGAYDTKVILPTTARGRYELEVFQVSARDGSDIELVRVPLTIR